MSDETTKTMRDLLERWAAMEPERCRPCESGEDEVEVSIKKGEWCQIILEDIITLDLMWVQWATQQAIISRGWRFNLECYPVTAICEGVVFLDLFHVRRPGGDPATALLTAYLAALENAINLEALTK